MIGCEVLDCGDGTTKTPLCSPSNDSTLEMKEGKRRIHGNEEEERGQGEGIEHESVSYEGIGGEGVTHESIG